MNISARLRTIASLVKDNSSIVDVGCDHGLLDIYLTKYKNVHCVASDNKASCLNNAISNIKKYNLEDRIETILCDGVEGIDLDTIDTVIISGMGTDTIINIIKNKNINHMIIQSNNNLYELRKKITNMGYMIINEVVVFEYKYYVIIEFIKGNKKYNELELRYGPILLNNNNKEYFTYLYNKLNNIKKKNKNLPFKDKFYIWKLKKYC